MHVLLSLSPILLFTFPFAGLPALFLYLGLSLAAGFGLLIGKLSPLKRGKSVWFSHLVHLIWAGVIYVFTISSLQGSFWSSGIPWAMSLVILPAALLGFSERLARSSSGSARTRHLEMA